MKHVAAKLILVLVASCSLAASAAQPERDLKQTLIERLLVMKDVAAYKWVNNLPVEDMEREAQVLAATVEQASRGGVDSELASKVVQAQIDAAKRIQSRWFASWETQSGPSQAPDLVGEIRPRISELTVELIEHLALLDSAPLAAAELNRLRVLPLALQDDSQAWDTAIAPFLKSSP